MSIKAKAVYITSATLLIIFYGVFTAIIISKTDQWRIVKAKEYLYEAKSFSNSADKLVFLEKVAFLNPNEKSYLDVGTLALEIGDSWLAEKYLSRVKTAEGYYQLGSAYYNLDKYDLAITNFIKSLSISETDEANKALGKSYLKIGDLEKAKAYLLKESDLSNTNLLVLLGATTDNSNVSREANLANKAILIYDAFIDLGYPQSAKSILNSAEVNGNLTRDGLIALANDAFDEGNYQKNYDSLQKARMIDPYYPQIYQQLVIVCEKLGNDDEAVQYRNFYDDLIF